MATTTRVTPWIAWPLLLFTATLYVVWFYHLQSETSIVQSVAYHQTTERLKSYTKTVYVSNLTSPIVIANDNPFRTTSIWVYVSDTSPLPASYRPQSLLDFSNLAHAPESEVQLIPVAGKALERLFMAATHAGRPLALSSAYRTISDQKALYDSSRVRYGSVYTDKYVARPLASEHHTGLAVDISDYSKGCLDAAALCTLSSGTAAWLAAEAPKFGFILRYPAEKEASTGVAYEPWHFRYVGKAAPALTIAGLTLDDFVKKVNADS